MPRNQSKRLLNASKVKATPVDVYFNPTSNISKSLILLASQWHPSEQAAFTLAYEVFGIDSEGKHLTICMGALYGVMICFLDAFRLV